MNTFKYIRFLLSLIINISAIILIAISLSDNYDLQIQNVQIFSETSKFVTNTFLKSIVGTVVSSANLVISLINILPMLPFGIFLLLITIGIIINVHILKENKDYSIGFILRGFANIMTIASLSYCWIYATFDKNTSNIIADLKLFKIVKELSINAKKEEFAKMYNTTINDLYDIRLAEFKTLALSALDKGDTAIIGLTEAVTDLTMSTDAIKTLIGTLSAEELNQLPVVIAKVLEQGKVIKALPEVIAILGNEIAQLREVMAATGVTLPESVIDTVVAIGSNIPV